MNPTISVICIACVLFVKGKFKAYYRDDLSVISFLLMRIFFKHFFFNFIEIIVSHVIVLRLKVPMQFYICKDNQ